MNKYKFEYKEKVSAKELSTYRGGGEIKLVAFPSSVEEIREVIAVANSESLPFFILGNGSNILIKDEGYNGIAISLKKFDKATVYKNRIYAQAGVSLKKLYAVYAIENNLSGLERIAGIPATLGGAIAGNAGAYGVEIKDLIDEVDILDATSLRVKRYKAKDLMFNYRDSLIKHSDLIALGASLILDEKPKDDIIASFDECCIKRKNTQPILPSLGSVFMRDGDVLPAKLIDNLGLKGYRVGGAEISLLHANFIVNVGNGTAYDYLRVVEDVKREVKNAYGITLKLEIKVL